MILVTLLFSTFSHTIIIWMSTVAVFDIIRPLFKISEKVFGILNFCLQVRAVIV